MTALAESADALAWALNLAIAQTFRERPRPSYVRNRFWPSDLFSCKRRVGLGFVEAPKDPAPPHTDEARAWGNLIHDEYGRRLAAVPGVTVLAKEQSLELTLPGLSLPVKGRFDFLIQTTPANLLAALFPESTIPPVVRPLQELTEPVRLLLDVKSSSSLTVAEAISGGPRLADRAEITCYEYATGVNLGLLIYHDRDRAAREIIPVPYDENLLAQCAAWLAHIEADLAAGLVPDAEFDPAVDSFPCGSCAFRTYCATLPNRVSLVRRDPDDDALALATGALAAALPALSPLRAALAPALADTRRIAVDGVRAERPWRPEPSWDLQRLEEIFAAFGITDVAPTPEGAQRLAREGRLPATALVRAQTPARADQIVLRL